MQPDEKIIGSLSVKGSSAVYILGYIEKAGLCSSWVYPSYQSMALLPASLRLEHTGLPCYAALQVHVRDLRQFSVAGCRTVRRSVSVVLRERCNTSVSRKVGEVLQIETYTCILLLEKKTGTPSTAETITEYLSLRVESSNT